MEVTNGKKANEVLVRGNVSDKGDATVRRSRSRGVGVCGNSLQTKHAEQRQAAAQLLQGCALSAAVRRGSLEIKVNILSACGSS